MLDFICLTDKHTTYRKEVPFEIQDKGVKGKTKNDATGTC